jgi:hypothetical protein
MHDAWHLAQLGEWSIPEEDLSTIVEAVKRDVMEPSRRCSPPFCYHLDAAPPEKQDGPLPPLGHGAYGHRCQECTNGWVGNAIHHPAHTGKPISSS